MLTKEEMRRKLNLFFTTEQLEAYKLIHPGLGGMTIKKAAESLGISENAVRKRLDKMKKAYPYAFRWQDEKFKKTPRIGTLNAIYGGYKAIATKKGVEFTLTKDDVYEIIQLPCAVCNKEPCDEAITEDGGYFKHHYLRRITAASGFTYLNTEPVCPKHSNVGGR